MQGNAEDRYAAIKADREAEAVPDADAEGKVLTKKQRLALEKEAEKERTKRSKLVEGRLEPQVRTLCMIVLFLIACKTTWTHSDRQMQRRDYRWKDVGCAACMDHGASAARQLLAPDGTMSHQWVQAKAQVRSARKKRSYHQMPWLHGIVLA